MNPSLLTGNTGTGAPVSTTAIPSPANNPNLAKTVDPTNPQSYTIPGKPLASLIGYSKANPTSQIANLAKQYIQSGKYDQQALAEGTDLSWAGRPSLEDMKSASETPIEKIAGGIGSGISKVAGAISDFGNEAADKTAQQYQEASNKIGSSITGGAQKIEQGTGFVDPGSPESRTAPTMADAQSAIGAAESGLGTAAGGVQAIFAPITGIIQAISDKASDSKALQDFATGNKTAGGILDLYDQMESKLNDISKSHPELAQNIGDAANVLLSVIGDGETEAGKTDVGQAAAETAKNVKDTAGTAMTTAKDAASSVVNGVKAVGEGAAKGASDAGSSIGSAATSVSSPFAKSYDPQLGKMFESENIRPPISAVSSSPFLRLAEANAAKGAFGGKVMAQYADARNALESKLEGAAKQATPEKTMSEENLGKEIQQGLFDSETKFKDAQDKIFTAHSKQYGDVSSEAGDTKKVLSDIVSDQGLDFFKGVNSRFKNMYERLTGQTDEVKGLQNTLSEAKKNPSTSPETVQKIQKEITQKMADNEKTLNFKELKSTRTSVGEEIAKDPDNGALKRLYGALSNDMEKAVTKHGGADAKTNLRKLNADYQSGKMKLEGRLASSIEQSNPERIAQNLITRNSADSMKVLKEMIGPKRFEEVTKSFMRNLIEKSYTRGRFDIAKLRSNLGDYDQATLDEVLNPAEEGKTNDTYKASLQTLMDRADKFEKMSDALKHGEKILGGSQTAFLRQAGEQTALGTSALTSLLMGNVPGFTLSIGALGGRYGISKLLTSDFGRKLLTGAKSEAVNVRDSDQ